MTPFAGQRIAVMGLGRAGLPAARALVRYGAAVVAWDDGAAARTEAAELPLRDLRTGDFDFDALLLSPGIPHRLPAPHPVAARAVAAAVPILCDAEFLFRAVRAAGSEARFIGVTGTNGKSTTTALLAHLLREAGLPVAAGANLGPAALSLPILPDHGAYVLEMSSYMLERIATLRFNAAVMLNLSPDHLDRHGDMQGYAAAKRAIFARQNAADLAVHGVDDSWAAEMHGASPARWRGISGERAVPGGVWAEAGLLRDEQGPIVELARLPALPGAHNAQNAAAAACVALDLGLSRAQVAAALASFPGLPHRQERVGAYRGAVFINDSKATNADAAARALASYARVVWIAGGRAKAGGIAPLAPLFPRVAQAVLIGECAESFAATLREAGVPHALAGNLERAVPAAAEAAHRLGVGTVLLSPAAASFDQFSGFEARGERFRALVAALHAASGEAA
jgi:UDP-N-acetylmuramoylalanine--D-glutamate ligase